MKRIFGWLSSLLIAGACDTSTVPTYEPQPDEAVTSIAHLKTRCTGHSLTLTQDIRLHCVVTANDHYGEFDHELVVADPSGGIEIEVDATELYRICPLDTEFTLYCNGLALGNYGGKILLGVPSGGTYVVDRIPESELGRYLRRETFSGTCARSFYVGDTVKKEDIHAKFEDGILHITLPAPQQQKALPANPNLIEIE